MTACTCGGDPRTATGHPATCAIWSQPAPAPDDAAALAAALDGLVEEVVEAVVEGDAQDCSSPDCIANAVYEIVRARFLAALPAHPPAPPEPKVAGWPCGSCGALTGEYHGSNCEWSAAPPAPPEGPLRVRDLYFFEAGVEEGKRLAAPPAPLPLDAIQMPVQLVRSEWPPNPDLRPGGSERFDAVYDSLRRGEPVREPITLRADLSVIDGMHRLTAARLLGLATIPVRVWTGHEWVPARLATPEPTEPRYPWGPFPCKRCGTPSADCDGACCLMHWHSDPPVTAPEPTEDGG